MIADLNKEGDEDLAEKEMCELERARKSGPRRHDGEPCAVLAS